MRVVDRRTGEGFRGKRADSASADAGVSSRLLASFLSWMQDRKAPVFVAATCNNVSGIAARTDSQGTLRRIILRGPSEPSGTNTDFRDSTKKRKRNPGEFDLERVSAAARGFSGAEIESVVQTALYSAYSQKQQLADQYLLEAIQATVPLSTTGLKKLRLCGLGRKKGPSRHRLPT